MRDLPVFPDLRAFLAHAEAGGDLLRIAEPVRGVDLLVTSPSVLITPYRDGFGNWCSRLEAPAGRIKISTSAIVRVSGVPDPVVPEARQHPVWELPEETLPFLLGSRYCETDLLTEFAWSQFGQTPLGWGRVQAICNFVNQHIRFDYMQARPTRTAVEVFRERVGVCRDYAHLCAALLRAQGVAARVAAVYAPGLEPMEFHAEAKRAQHLAFALTEEKYRQHPIGPFGLNAEPRVKAD